MYQREGKYALAETSTAQVLSWRRHAFGPDSPPTLEAAAGLALAYQSQGKFAGEPLSREVAAFYRTKRPDDWQRFRTESLLGAILAGQRRFAGAEPLLLEGYEGMAARKHQIAVPDWYYLDLAGKWLVQFYIAWNKPEKAAEWKKRTG